MANSPAIVPVALKQGLDTTTPAMMAEPGSLIDCLNYEMTGDSGYRRIDGYESYDGWTSGNVVDYYRVNVNITDSSITSTLVAGAILYQTATTTRSVALGTIVSYNFGVVTYVPLNKNYPVIVSGTSLDTTYFPSGGTSRMSASANAISGLGADSASTFVTNVRSYGTTLRNLVQSFDTPVAGVHWFRDNLIVALDCPVIKYTGTASAVQEGYLVSYNGITYRVVDKANNGTAITLHVEPVGTTTVSTSLKQEGNSTTIATLATTGITLTKTSSRHAYLVSANNPSTSSARGTTLLKRSVILQFTGGVAAAETKFVSGSILSVGTDAANYNRVYVKNCVVTSGTFAANSAAGYLEVIMDAGLLGYGGETNYITTSQTIRDFTSTNQYAVISAITRSKVSGTKSLLVAGTRYQWVTANFFGQESTTEAYGATGKSRGFWAHAYVDPLTAPVFDGDAALSASTYDFSWGSIPTDLVNDSLDIPKYVAFHSNRLAFGFVGGSVELSVVGEPYNFDGSNGAGEVATGDQLTGLVEAQGDSLIVFGRRAIRRITGAANSALSLTTLSPNAGAYDYTACAVGSTVIFTGPAGVSTIEQSQAYGDFLGKRASFPVSLTLNPLLTTDMSTTMVGGAAMAMPVRSKDQYRLWLASGEVYTFTLATDGVRIMKSNYGLGNDVRVPLAWSSQVSDTGKERIFVVWDKDRATTGLNATGNASTLPDEKRVYQMDTGWGFDGKTFSYHFDLAHLFNPAGQAYMGIERVRLMGYGHGLATLDIKSAGVESGFDQTYHSAVQDISLPISLTTFYRNMQQVTSIVDQANWGLGIKLRIQGSLQENLTTTEPSHVCQVLILTLRLEGVQDA